ncbi:MAG: radical SAM protein [Humidesulfovibrio sp.]|nr:7-carboxy-7-deazaguanine synthase [Desulfovibrio sp.]MDO9084070.1 radical SAM protein [Humidesulfovibrio sp.]
MSLQVCETFLSIQGESSHAGWPCAFVRLTGCNLRCRYCDTAYAYAGGAARSVDDIVVEVRATRCRRVEITGGEPLLQSETPELAAGLTELGLTVLVETNGSLDIRVLPPQVIAIVDMKGPSSGEQDRMDLGNLTRLRGRDEVKFVLADRADYAHMLELLPRIDPARNTVNASPQFGVLPPQELAAWILADGLDVRLNLQQHKHIWPPDKRGV